MLVSVNGRFKEGDWSRKWWMTFVKRDFMNLELTLVSFVSSKQWTSLAYHSHTE